MATGGEGSAPYESTGVGGKFRKRPFQRSIPATPYDRPSTALKNNNRNMLKKLVDPASRLIYAGTHRLFDVFRKNLPPPSLQGSPVVNEEPRNVPWEERRSGNSANVATATEISELEQMLQEKTFTRSEIQRLTSLLHSRTTESPSDYSLKKHGDVRVDFNAANATPVVTPKVFEEVASPVELAKSYMGSRPATNQAHVQHSKLIQRTPITPLALKTANSLRDLENGFVTPRSRGRSSMYTSASTPYTRNLTFSQKGILSDYGRGAASTSSQSVLGHEAKMSLKRRSSVLDDVIESGSPLRRIRHKANVLSQRDKKELGYTVFQQDGLSQNLVLPDETEPRVFGYASVPAKSIQTANKILQHLENPSPNEKNSVPSHARLREKSPNKLTSDMLHGQALRSMEKLDLPKFLPSPRDFQKPEAQHHARFHEPTSQSKDKTEENSSRKFPIPCNVLTSVNGDSTDSLKYKAPIFGLVDLPLKVHEGPLQKKRSFQMSASEDSVEIDDGHVSFPFVKNNKPETSVADITKTPAVHEVSKSHTLVRNSNPVLLEVAKVPAQAEVKETENTSFPNTDVGCLGGSVCEQGLGIKIPISAPSTTITHSSVIPQSTLQMEKIIPEKDSSSFSFVKAPENTSTTITHSSVIPQSTFQMEKITPEKDSSSFSFVKATENTTGMFSANKLPEVRRNASSVPKTMYSLSVNGNEIDHKSTSVIGKSVSSVPAVPTNGSFLFGTATKNLSAPNMTPASNPTTFSSLAPFPTPASTSAVTSTTNTANTTISTMTTTAASIFSASVAPPVFSFGSAYSTALATSVAEDGNTSNRSPFPITSFATTTIMTTTESGLLGFSSPAATLTTITQSQGSFFNITNGSQTNTHASSSSTLFVSSSFFGSSPSFDIKSLGPTSETNSGNSTSGSTPTIFGSAWQQPQKSSGLDSTFSPSPSPSVFTFGASSTPTPLDVTGGATNSSFAGTSVFGAASTSPNNSNNNNDQTSMEDSMAEDHMQTHSPVSPFGQAPMGAPGFMFSSAVPTPTPSQSPAVVPFQFGGQSNQAPPPQIPFQSSSLEFNAGGRSFSLGSGGEKSNRRIVRVSKSKNRRK